MEVIKDAKYRLLVNKIKKIAEVIGANDPTEESVHEAVVDFVFVLENLVKKSLSEKSKLLIHNFGSLDTDKVIAVLDSKDIGLFSVNIREAIARYKKVYPKSALSEQDKSLDMLITNRNYFQHDIDLRNAQDKIELTRLLSTVFSAMLESSKAVLGDLALVKIKEQKTYSKEDVQELFDRQVKSKIESYERDGIFMFSPISLYKGTNLRSISPVTLAEDDSYAPNISYYDEERCPRCSRFALSRKHNLTLNYLRKFESNEPYYICSHCNLELTQLEYEAVQRLIKDGKIKV